MRLLHVAQQFQTDEQCLDYIEARRWPSGVCCIHCGSLNISRIKRTTEGKGKNQRTRLYQCLEKECGKQFSTTSGTIFDGTHLPLPLWFQALSLILEAKKGMSAMQVQRHLDLKSYKTAWYLCHRIRKAMKEPQGPLEGIVETDETYMTPRKPRKGHPKPKNPNRDVVIGMIERGGRLRLIPAKDAKLSTIEPLIAADISHEASLQTDKSLVYELIGARRFPGRHKMIDHLRSMGIGDNNTNSIENAFSLFKRGIYGSFHKVSLKHLGRYCAEFEYRFNRRDRQNEMFHETMTRLAHGTKLPFKTLVQ